MKRYWVKTHVKDIFSRERMQMPDWLFRRLIEFEAFAADFGEEGLLPSVADMAWSLRPFVDETKLSEALQALSKVGEVEETPRGWRLTHFEQRQSKVSDAERQRQSRERHEDVTKRDSSVTDSVTTPSISISSSDSLSEEEGGMGGETDKEKEFCKVFVGYFGKFQSPAEIGRWVDLFEKVGQSRVIELAEWALKKEIHLENRPSLLDSLETASKNWQTKPPKGGQTTRSTTAPSSWLQRKEQELAQNVSTR